MLRRRRRQEAGGDGSGPIVVAIVVVIAIVVAAAGGEVADEEDVQRCEVQCLTLFFQRWRTWDSRRKKQGNTILVKLELWELVMVFNNNFYSATNLCLRHASAKCGR